MKVRRGSLYASDRRRGQRRCITASSIELSEETPITIWQGTLDLMILRTLATLGPRHSYAIATRLEQVSDELLKVNQGTLYPALVQLEQNGLQCRRQ